MFLALAAGCRGRGGAPELPGTRSSDPIRVAVTNNNYLDVVVFAVSGGQAQRLGNVTGNSTASFQLPRVLSVASAGVQLLVDPIGSSDAWFSDSLYLWGGALVDLTVGPSLSLSSVSVR